MTEQREERVSWVQAVATVIVGIAMLMFVWSITGGPMIRNYQECGTIFLCSAQSPR